MEVDNDFHKSSFCIQGDCVEAQFGSDFVKVRDSKDPHSPVLLFTKDEWDAFIKGAKNGEFDLKT